MRPRYRYRRKGIALPLGRQVTALDDTRSSGAGVELAPALPEARSQPAHFGDPTGTVSCEVGVGGAVGVPGNGNTGHASRCITSTAFGDVPRDRGSTRNRMVKLNPPARRLVGRRIRLTGLLRRKPRKRGFFYGPICRRLVRLAPRRARLRSPGTARRGRPASPRRLCRLRAAPRHNGNSIADVFAAPGGDTGSPFVRFPRAPAYGRDQKCRRMSASTPSRWARRSRPPA